MRVAAAEVADVVRLHGEAFLQAYPGLGHRHRRILEDIAYCRTSRFGGHLLRCDHCGHEDQSYNSCRNRYCPKCGGARRRAWTRKRLDELLPVPYFHLVFTVPDEVARLALQNKGLLYSLLITAAADTLKQVAADPRHLGARVGALSVLHTWGQNLEHHPHAHMIVPGGGLRDGPEGPCWHSSRNDFFLPVRVLRSVFRGKLLCRLEELHTAGKLRLVGRLAALQDPAAFQRYLRPLWKKKWVVYAKRPFGGPEQVLKYLARYTHRVAISNSRILSVDTAGVRFSWKDYRDGQTKVMALSGPEFLRRFMTHVCPAHFKRIRYHGILAVPDRKERFAEYRRLALLARGVEDSRLEAQVEGDRGAESSATEDDEYTQACPVCEAGRMLRVRELPPHDDARPQRRAQAPP